MKATISKTFRFEASHQLINHDGKCSNPHGHSYEVSVAVEGPVSAQKGDPKEGMVVDFSDIKDVWDEHLKPTLDHQDLNQHFLFPTTAENIAAWVCVVFARHGVPITSVTVYETATSSATVYLADIGSSSVLLQALEVGVIT